MSVSSTEVSVLINRVWHWMPLVALMAVLGVYAGWSSTLNDTTTYTTRATLTVVSQNRSPDQDAILSQGYADFFNDDVYQTKLRDAAGVPADVTFAARTALASPILYVTATSASEDDVRSAASAMASALRTQVNSAIDQTHQDEIDSALDAYTQLRKREPNVPSQALLDLNSEISSIAGDSTNKLQNIQLDSSISAATPSKVKRVGLGLAAGLFLGVLAAVVLGGLTRRLRSASDVERILGEPPLAVLPDGSDSAEAALLWTTLQRFDPPVGSVVAVTHAHSRERTDAVAQQLVQAASRLGTAIVLDWRSLSATEDVGLSDYVANGELGVDDVIREVAPDLFAMSYGTVAGDPYAVLSSSRTAELLRQLRTSFQAVIIETPAVRQTVEGSVACTLADATVLAVDQRRSRSNEVADAAIDLARLRVRVGGVVLLLSGRGKQPHTSGWSGSARDHHADGRPESQISPESGAQPDPETEGEPAPLMHLPSNTGVSTADAEFDTESATSTDESQRSVQGHDELTGEKV